MVKEFLLLFKASKTTCLDESIMTSLQSREEYSDETYSESSEDIMEAKQRMLNLGEPKAWGAKTIMKMSPPTVNKPPNPATNLPLRFGRNFPEERSLKPAANLPLRFGRALAGSLARPPLPFSHRFGNLYNHMKKESGVNWEPLDQFPY
ncbi:hypothetical protein lerEdw1_020294 [Lerista edwardsae]|nr:hypothetical protein lerEdw1_020294 [Lerista edwardsae]